MAVNPGPLGNITGSTNVTYVQQAYDRMAYFALRPELIFDQLADVKSVNQSMPGSSVTFTIQNDLVAAVTPLSQTTDITTQTLSNSQITVALQEYGSAVTTSAVLRGEAYVEIDPIVANVIGYNAGVSIDSVARDSIGQGTQWKVPTGASLGASKTATIANVAALSTGATASYNDILAAQKNLRAQNVAPFGSYYAAVIHPDVAYDLQLTNNYLAPHQYAQPAEIWAGEVGALNGFRFIETPRAQVYNSPADDNVQPLTLAENYTAGDSAVVLAGVNGFVLAEGATFTITDSATGFVVKFKVIAPTIGAPAAPTSVSVDFVGTDNDLAAATSSVVVTSGGTGLGSPVYTTYLMGRQSLAKVHSIVDGNGPVPKIIPGPITDTLRRFVPLGWYWLGGYSVFRQPAVIQYFTQSSLSNIDPAIDN